MAEHIDWLEEQAQEFFKVGTSNIEDEKMGVFVLQVFFPEDFDLTEIVRFSAIHKLDLGMVFIEDRELVVEFYYSKGE